MQIVKHYWERRRIARNERRSPCKRKSSLFNQEPHHEGVCGMGVFLTSTSCRSDKLQVPADLPPRKRIEVSLDCLENKNTTLLPLRQREPR
jgi:hypothetical protein